MNEKLFPSGAAERKTYPVYKGLLDYFPNACAAIAHHSFEGNEQHNPGEPMHWAKEKSIGTGDEIVRHLMEGHLEAMAWRALELLERKLTGLPPFENSEETPSPPENEEITVYLGCFKCGYSQPYKEKGINPVCCVGCSRAWTVGERECREALVRLRKGARLRETHEDKVVEVRMAELVCHCGSTMGVPAGEPWGVCGNCGKNHSPTPPVLGEKVLVTKSWGGACVGWFGEVVKINTKRDHLDTCTIAVQPTGDEYELPLDHLRRCSEKEALKCS